ncbi:hypothetical protein Hanom_Chr15g01353491 [Helianthus anomalus]
MLNGSKQVQSGVDERETIVVILECKCSKKVRQSCYTNDLWGSPSLRFPVLWWLVEIPRSLVVNAVCFSKKKSYLLPTGPFGQKKKKTKMICPIYSLL